MATSDFHEGLSRHRRRRSDLDAKFLSAGLRVFGGVRLKNHPLWVRHSGKFGFPCGCTIAAPRVFCCVQIGKAISHITLTLPRRVVPAALLTITWYTIELARVRRPRQPDAAFSLNFIALDQAAGRLRQALSRRKPHARVSCHKWCHEMTLDIGQSSDRFCEKQATLR